MINLVLKKKGWPRWEAGPFCVLIGFRHLRIFFSTSVFRFLHLLLFFSILIPLFSTSVSLSSCICSTFFSTPFCFFQHLSAFFNTFPLFSTSFRFFLHLFLGYRLSIFSCLGLGGWSYLFFVTRLSDFLCLSCQLTAVKSAFLSLNLECKGDFCLSGSAKKTFRKRRKTFRKCKKCGKKWPEYPENGRKCVKTGRKCVNWCIFNLKSLLFDLYFVRLHYLCIRKRFLMVKVYG